MVLNPSPDLVDASLIFDSLTVIVQMSVSLGAEVIMQSSFHLRRGNQFNSRRQGLW